MSSKFIDMSDEKYFGLFGDAGSATAIEFTKDKKFETPLCLAQMVKVLKI